MATTTVNPSKDTFVDSANPSANYGGFSYLDSENTTTDKYMHLSFDLSAIDAGDDCTSATLYLYLRDASGATYTRTYEVWKHKSGNADWLEGSSTSGTAATWNYKNDTTDTAWLGGSNGGGVLGTDIDGVSDGTVTPLGTLTVATGQAADSEHTITLDAATVEAFFGATLHLFIRRTDAGTAQKFRSSEYTTDTTKQPKLEIVHTTPGGGDTLTVGTVTVDYVAQSVAQVTAAFTGDADNNRTAAFEYSPSPFSAWTSANAKDTVTYTNGSDARIVLTGLTPGTTYKARVTWTNSGGTVSGTNPAESAEFTTLEKPSRLDSPQFEVRTAVFYEWDQQYTNDTAEDWSKADWWIGTRPSPSTPFNAKAIHSAIRSYGRSAAMDEYAMLAEVYHDNNADPLARSVIPRRNTFAFDPTASSALNTLLASDETMLLHAGGATKAYRVVASDGAKWVLNPANSNVRTWVRQQLVRMALEDHSTKRSDADQRFTGVFLDNVSCRPQYTSDEYGAAKQVNATYRGAVTGLVDYISDTGVWLTGNVINGVVLTGSTYEIEDVANHLDGFMWEEAFKQYSHTSEDNPAADDPPYKTVANWVAEMDMYKRIFGAQPAANGYTWPSTFEVLAVAQGYDPSKDATLSETSQRFAYWSYLMATDAARDRFFYRWADGDNAGYMRFRQLPNDWTRATGDATGNVSNDTGNIYKRTFANGTAYLNVGATAATATNATAGTLAARTGTWVASSANPVPVISSISPTSRTEGTAGSFTLTVNGSGFISGSTVYWNGASRTTTFVNTGQLTATVNAADVASQGTATVTVVTAGPGGGTSNAATFTITAASSTPVAASLSPASIPEDSGDTVVTVTGTGFTSSSQVTVNGVPRATTYVSATTLTFVLLAAELTDPATLEIDVI